MTASTTPEKKAPSRRFALPSFFFFGLYGGLAWGFIDALRNVYQSAALPYSLWRLAVETFAANIRQGLTWGLIFGALLLLFGVVFTRITGTTRRAIVTMAITLLFWLAFVGAIVGRLIASFGKKLPLPYQEHVTVSIFLSRFIWPIVDYAVTARPMVVFALLLVTFVGAALPAAAVYHWLLRQRLPEQPLRRVPSLAFAWRGLIAGGLVLVLAAGVVVTPRLLPRPPKTAPNVLLVSIDTLRADGLHCYGNPLNTSPTIDALAARGVRYDNYYASAPWTLPGHVSMLTGMIPDVHGVYILDRKVPRQALLLSEIFKNAGYYTFSVTSNFLVSPSYGFGRGFDRVLFRPEAAAHEVVARTVELLPRARAPWFAFIHFFDPHLPYTPTKASRDEFGLYGPAYKEVLEQMTHLLFRFVDVYLPYSDDLKQAVRALYDAEVRDSDRGVARILVELGKKFDLSNTVVVITSDHGEEFFEHGWIGHSVSLFDESLRVPLVITGPGVPAGEVRSESAAMPLLPPLILSLAGVADPLHRDLAAIQATGAYGHTHAFGSPRYSLRTNDYRYLTPSEFTYGAYTKTYPPGLFRDRAEQQNLIAELPDVATQMQGALEKYVEEEIKHYGAMDPASLEIDTNRLQRLKELGYVN